MSANGEDAKLDKREREESAEANPGVKDTEAPPTKKVKADGDADTVEPTATSSTATETPGEAGGTSPGGISAGENSRSEAVEESKVVDVKMKVDEGTAESKVTEETTKDKPQAANEDKAVDKIDSKAEDKTGEKPEKTLSIEEAEVEALKMLEFYFGNSNYSWDRFMQSKAGKMGEGLMEISILLKFNKLKAIADKAGLDDEAAKAMIARLAESSEKLRVDEGKTQIGRLAPMTEDDAEERVARTIQTKGYKKDAKLTIEDVESLFKETGKAVYVKICRSGNRKLTSVFVEFDTKESADEACEKSEQFTHDGEKISVKKVTRLPGKGDADGKDGKDGQDAKDKTSDGADSGEPAGPAYESGKIIHVTGIPEAGVSRESLKGAITPFGTVLYVDFSFGAREAWLRMEKAEEATAALEGTKEGGVSLGADIEEKGALAILEGEIEKEYYERVERSRAERFSRSSNGKFRGRGRGRRGRGGGRGGRGRGSES